MSDCSSFLDQITIASPCTADWSQMTGDERVRFCGLCQLNVYNLSAMNRTEAEALMQEKEGRVCVRFYRRADGTLLTQDCPVGLKARYQKRVKTAGLGIAAAAVTLITVFGAFTTVAYAGGKSDHPVMGEMVAPPVTQQKPPSQPMMGAPLPNPTPGGPAPGHTMGKIKVPNPGNTGHPTEEVGKPASHPTGWTKGKPMAPDSVKQPCKTPKK